MLRWVCAAILGGLLTGAVALLLISELPHAGHVVFVAGPGRGIHEADLVIVGAWVVAMVALAVLLFSRRDGK
jgi:hypothetical protein